MQIDSKGLHMLELGKELVNKSDMTLRLLQKSDFFEFRRAATESTESNYEYLAYGELFENLNIFDFSKAYLELLENKDLEHWGVTASHPGDYLKVLYDLDEGVVVSVLHRMAELRGKSISDMLSRLSAAVPTFTAYVASDLGLEVPPYSRPEWRP
jgi:hypothetical protein